MIAHRTLLVPRGKPKLVWRANEAKCARVKYREIIANVCCGLIASTIAYGASQAGSSEPTDAFLAQLKNPNPEARIAALRELQTSLDPRIPDAMLSLLSDEGNSIRRIAARTIGSRWWQISKDKVPQFVEALRRNEKSEFEDEKNMIVRGIGLLTRDYKSKMFARSGNSRWVVYERRGLPCLIDTTTDTEELLGSPRDESTTFEWMLLPALGNEPLGDAVVWHPTKEAVAFSVLKTRHSTMVWVWEHRFGLQKLEAAKLMELLKLKEPVEEPNPFTAEVKEWKNNELYVSVSWGRDDQSAVIAWDLSKHTWRVVSREASAKG
jgi:HEAT repeats